MLNINCKGRIIHYTRPCIMGILNVTEESFYDGGKYLQESSITERVQQLLKERADIIDIGCMATNPQARVISEEEELYALKTALQALQPYMDKAIYSIDTYRAGVAYYAISHGVHIINDISGGAFDPDMLTVTASMQVPYVLTHTTNRPQYMQQHTQYKDLIGDILYYMSEKIHTLHAMGVSDIIIDPGFGFGKTIEQNYALLGRMDVFRQLQCPILAGISRKSMLYKPMNITPQQALPATTAANTIALLHGADILRVHDVEAAWQAMQVVELLK